MISMMTISTWITISGAGAIIIIVINRHKLQPTVITGEKCIYDDYDESNDPCARENSIFYIVAASLFLFIKKTIYVFKDNYNNYHKKEKEYLKQIVKTYDDFMTIYDNYDDLGMVVL